MELKLGVLLLAFMLSNPAKYLSVSSSAATSPSVSSSVATSPSVSSSAATSPSVRSSAATSPSVSSSAATSPSVSSSAATSPSVSSSAATSPSVSPSAATSPSVSSSAATSPSVSSSAATSPSVSSSAATSPSVSSSAATSPSVSSSAATSPNVSSSAATSPSVSSSAATSPSVSSSAATSPSVSSSAAKSPRVTTAQSTAAKKETTTTVDPAAVPNLDGAQFNVELKFKVMAEFNETLLNSSSALYGQYVIEFENKVTPMYEKIPGFLYVYVTGFSNGSIDIHHNVALKANVDGNGVQTYVTGSLKNDMKNMTIFNKSGSLNEADITNFLDTIKNKCNAQGMCHKGYTCKGGTSSDTTCQLVCTRGYCHQGTCNVNEDGKPVCKCHVKDDVVYGGDRCDTQGTHMSMSTGAIAGIAGGVGGGAILLLSIALGCMCCSRRKGKNTEKDINPVAVPLSERDMYNHIQPGQFNYGADIKDEYRYTGRNNGRGYEEWLMSNDRSEHEPSGRRRDDFRASSYSGNWGRDHGDDRGGDNASMEPASKFGRGMRSSGFGTSQHSFPEDVAPDYDQDDKRQMSPNPRDHSRENPYTRMPSGQPPSRPQSSLLSNSYKQSGSVYEHIDTDDKYAIRRPSFR